MGISKKTIEIISENASKFIDEIRDTINTLIDLAINYSPLSDVNYLVSKSNTVLKGIKIKTESNSWVPIRNLIRIIDRKSVV